MDVYTKILGYHLKVYTFIRSKVYTKTMTGSCYVYTKTMVKSLYENQGFYKTNSKQEK